MVLGAQPRPGNMLGRIRTYSITSFSHSCGNTCFPRQPPVTGPIHNHVTEITHGKAGSRFLHSIQPGLCCLPVLCPLCPSTSACPFLPSAFLHVLPSPGHGSFHRPCSCLNHRELSLALTPLSLLDCSSVLCHSDSLREVQMGSS